MTDERMRLVIRLKDGETMASLCRKFGISRKTGYKIFERYEQCGLEGLSDRLRRPFRYANQLPAQVEAAIVSARREKPHWGAPRTARATPRVFALGVRGGSSAFLGRQGPARYYAGPARDVVLNEFNSFNDFLGHSVISYSFHVVYRIVLVLVRTVPCTACTGPFTTVRAGSVLNYTVCSFLENVH